MLTKLIVKNFKRFGEVEIDLSQSSVFIGPNNSGKTTALQALALWELGLRRWNEKRKNRSPAKLRQGVVINRRDLVALPVPAANLLWRDLHIRNMKRHDGKQKTQNIRIEITAEGIYQDQVWKCGFEFDYSNEEAFYCRPLRINNEINNTNLINNELQPERMPVPDLANYIKIALLPPMSGLADREFFKQSGEVSVLIGQGQTAQVLRNLCYRVCWKNENDHEHLNTKEKPSDDWKSLTKQLLELFGVTLLTPQFIIERSEIVLEYKEKSGVKLDISSSGRGLQQTLLILAHLYANPDTVLLLDEPDAHLEVLRQRQIYKLIQNLATEKGSQVISASHSEVVLEEAANLGTVIAFIGKPYILNNRTTQFKKSLTDLSWDQYYQAEQKGWVLYLEDSTDLAILQNFAKKLNHPAQNHLSLPFVHYLSTNLPQKSRDHFQGLREATKDLVGIALFDHLDKKLQPTDYFHEMMWEKREIENYFCMPDVLLAWAKQNVKGKEKIKQRQAAMEKAINEVTHVLEIDEKSPWSPNIKATDEVLDRIFRLFFKLLELPLLFRKSKYYELIQFLSLNQIDAEIIEKLDAIVLIAERSKPSDIL